MGERQSANQSIDSALDLTTRSIADDASATQLKSIEPIVKCNLTVVEIDSKGKADDKEREAKDLTADMSWSTTSGSTCTHKPVQNEIVRAIDIKLKNQEDVWGEHPLEWR